MGSPQRELARRQQAEAAKRQNRNLIKGPPPSAGAVDLGALKGPNQQQKDDGRRQLLQQQGLVCQCGALIRDEGVAVFTYQEGLIPTPQGPQPGINLGSAIFHSRDCPVLVGALAVKAGASDPKPIAIRDLPATEWLVDSLEEAYETDDDEHQERGATDNGDSADNAVLTGEPLPE